MISGLPLTASTAWNLELAEQFLHEYIHVNKRTEKNETNWVKPLKPRH